MGRKEGVVTAKMTKEQVRERVLRNGKPLELSKFAWDADSKVFSTKMCGLTFNFGDVSNCSFKTGFNCTFKTGNGCTFETGSYCTFETGYNCAFKTGYDCTFETGSYCTFNTGSGCTFSTGHNCTFSAGGGCVFKTGCNCTFKTWGNCTWVTEGKSYPFAPLLFQGSMWPVNVYRPGYLKIGCKEHTFKEWTWCAMRVAADEGVSQETLKEYICLTKVAREWAKQKGWLTPK